MSVFSLDVGTQNPVTAEVLDEICDELGMKIKDDEKEEYQRLLAVYHDSVVSLLELPDYVPEVDLERFPRENVRFPTPEENPLGAWAWRCDIEDKHAAKSSSPHAGLLAGRTVAVKDNIAVRDVPMLMGTDFVRGYVPDVDATAVTRLLEAGAVVRGKSVCENLCHSATSSSAATGHVHNPLARGYSSGGSSSGSGALVAAGEVDMALGADQGGSVRVPAGWCGIYGLKPTFGLIPYTGCGSNEPTNDHLGPMTRTVLDNALMLQCIAGTDHIDDRSSAAPPPHEIPRYHDALLGRADPTDLRGVRVGLLREALDQPSVEPRVRRAVLAAAASLRALGATVDENVSVPLHSQGAAIWTAVSKYGGYLAKRGLAFGRRGLALTDLQARFGSPPLSQAMWDECYVSSRNIYLNGAYAQRRFPELLGRATNLSRRLRDEYDAALGVGPLAAAKAAKAAGGDGEGEGGGGGGGGNYDVLLAPNLPYVARSHTPYDARPLDKIAKQVGLTANTAPFNQSGHPVLAMPIGMAEIQEGPLKGTGTRLPISMQVVGKWWHEDDVYRVAYAWSLANDWKEKIFD